MLKCAFDIFREKKENVILINLTKILFDTIKSCEFDCLYSKSVSSGLIIIRGFSEYFNT